MADGMTMTIEQLSLKAGVTTRNIRAYQSRGLLSPPETRGRVGYYGSGHLARLHLINSMQERGFSLAAIGELLTAWQNGRGLREVIGFETELTAALGREQTFYTLSQLHDLFGGDELNAEFMDEAAELGLLEKVGERYAVDHPQALRMGVEAIRSGIPPQAVLKEAQTIKQAANEVAERVVGVYVEHVWEPFVEAGMPNDRLEEVTEGLRRLHVLSGDMMGGLLSDSLGDVIRETAMSELSKSKAASRILTQDQVDDSPERLEASQNRS